jgi:hypothetical protein
MESLMGWKIYSWFFLLVVAAGYTEAFITEPKTILFYLDLIVTINGLAGLFAYAYKMKLVSANFWKVCFVLNVMWDLIYNTILQINTSASLVEELVVALGVALLLPTYVALYLLGFKSVNLWKTEK